MKINLLLGLSLFAVAVYAKQTPDDEHPHHHLLRVSRKTKEERRDLQPNPPDLPELPNDAGSQPSDTGSQPSDTGTKPSDTGSQPSDYCDFLFLFFQAQANTQGYECACNSDDDYVVIECEKNSLQCNAYNVGDVDSLCYKHHYTVTSSKTDVAGEGNQVLMVHSCAEYTEDAPEFLQLRSICFVYELNWKLGEYFNLETCEVTFDKEVGQPQQVCQCSTCETGNVLGVPIWGLALDCQAAFGIKLLDCIPLTEEGGMAIIPEIDEIFERSVTDSPSTTDLPNTTDPPVLASENSTLPSAPTSPPETDSGVLCDWEFELQDAAGQIRELACTCNTTADAFEVNCDSKRPECNAFNATGVEDICYDTSFSVAISPDWLSGITTFSFDVCADYAYNESAPLPLKGREFCLDYVVTWDWANLKLESCSATFAYATGQVEVCPCTICNTTDNQTGYALTCPTTNVSFLECQPVLSPVNVSLPSMEWGAENVSTTLPFFNLSLSDDSVFDTTARTNWTDPGGLNNMTGF